jgi:hypothetical protein
MVQFAAVREWTDVDPQTFSHEILPAYAPAVLRGLAGRWPSVERSRRSVDAIAAYVKSFDRGGDVESFVGDPSIDGRFFYDEKVRGYNFARGKTKISALVDHILGHRDDPLAPSIYMGAASLGDHLAGFAAENAIELVPPSVVPNIWIGNAATVSTHYDLSSNIACVVAGRRRFTFFPPDQLANLYVGPLEFTLAGQPVSMVSLQDPDLEAYPRFAAALAAATVAELEPGDAVYIPPLWWHHVEALDTFNLLVNYWWSSAPARAGSPFECLIHGLLTVRDLPAPEREAWRAVFDHYLFGRNGDPAAHLPPEARGVLGPPSLQRTHMIKSFLARALNRG